jgi:hypothetical protein
VCVCGGGQGVFSDFSWLKHYATNRKVASSIPDKASGFFNFPNLSSLTVVLRLTQPITEMSTRNLPRGLRAAGA